MNPVLGIKYLFNLFKMNELEMKNLQNQVLTPGNVAWII
jgi:hypothetical protein